MIAERATTLASPIRQDEVSKPGRPRGTHKCTESNTERICQLIRLGVRLAQACEAVGVSQRSGYAWMRQGRADERLLEKDENAALFDTSFLHFLQSVRTAEATCEIRLTALVQRHAQRNWRAAAWLLERRFPERWSKHATVRDIRSESTESLNELLCRIAMQIGENARGTDSFDDEKDDLA